MTSYTITVAPSDGTGNTTTIKVDTSNGEALITDVHLHADAGLTPARLPSLDIGLLMRAVTASPALASSPVESPALTAKPKQAIRATARSAAAEVTAPDAKAPDTAPATDEPAPAQPADPVAAEPTTQAVEPTVEPTAQPAARVRRPRAAKEPAVPTPAAKPRARRRAGAGDPEPAVAAPKRKTRAARDKNSAPDAAPEQERAYRRMPDDFAAVATRLNSATAIAEHYQVPRHTAQGWLRRVRTAAAAG